MSSNTFCPLLVHRSHAFPRAFFTFVYRSCWCLIFSPWWDWRVLPFVDNHVLNINILIELFFKVLYCPLRQMQVALPAYGTAATKAAWCSGSLTCADMLLHAIAHGGCSDTVRQSALEADSGRKISCRTGDSNPQQYCAWLFSRTLCQLS